VLLGEDTSTGEGAPERETLGRGSREMWRVVHPVVFVKTVRL
jgi:hypothetical protein